MLTFEGQTKESGRDISIWYRNYTKKLVGMKHIIWCAKFDFWTDVTIVLIVRLISFQRRKFDLAANSLKDGQGYSEVEHWGSAVLSLQAILFHRPVIQSQSSISTILIKVQ